MLLELPDELLGLVLDATEIPMGLRLASKRFSSMPRGKAKVRELQRQALRTFGVENCHKEEIWHADAARAAATHLLYSLAHYSAFIAFTPVEADKVRDHLVAQLPLLHRELIEGGLPRVDLGARR